MKTGKYPYPAAIIKGDEVELIGSGETTPEEWRNRKLNYLGRKSITRYGCYGCHDIPTPHIDAVYACVKLLDANLAAKRESREPALNAH